MTPNSPARTVECCGEDYTLNDVLEYLHMRSSNPFLEAAHEFFMLQSAEATALRARLQEAEDAGAVAVARAEKAEDEHHIVCGILSDARDYHEELEGQIESLRAKLAQEGEQERQLLQRDEELRKLREGMRWIPRAEKLPESLYVIAWEVPLNTAERISGLEFCDQPARYSHWRHLLPGPPWSEVLAYSPAPKLPRALPVGGEEVEGE
jgi:hypothetical protein